MKKKNYLGQKSSVSSKREMWLRTGQWERQHALDWKSTSGTLGKTAALLPPPMERAALAFTQESGGKRPCSCHLGHGELWGAREHQHGATMLQTSSDVSSVGDLGPSAIHIPFTRPKMPKLWGNLLPQMYLKFSWLCMGLPGSPKSECTAALDKGGWCENPGTRNEVFGLSRLVWLAAQKGAYLCCCSGMFRLGHGRQTKLAVVTLEPLPGSK